jgi:hypothetical protein
MDIEWNQCQEERKDVVRVAGDFNCVSVAPCGIVWAIEYRLPEETGARKEGTPVT